MLTGPLKEGEQVTLQGMNIKLGKTSPPKRLADDELEKAMENAGRIVESEDSEIIQQLKEKGIGTPATRTAIIQELMKREYIEIKKNLVYLTIKGRNFMDCIYDHPITSVELTGEFEKKLDHVAEGKLSAKNLLDEFKTFAHQLVSMQTELETKIKSRTNDKPLFVAIESIGNCPNCGKTVVEGLKGYGCVGWREGCKFVIWKSFRNKKISKVQAMKLLQGNEILLEGITKSDGKNTYSLCLKLKNDVLENYFPSKETTHIGQCLLCGHDVIENQKFYGCSKWKEGCKFVIPKEVLDKKLSVTQIRKLLESGKTDVIKGFKGKKEFASAITYDKEQQKNKISF